MPKAFILLVLLVTLFTSPMFGGEMEWVERLVVTNSTVAKSEKSLAEPERIGFKSAPKKPASGFKKAVKPSTIPNWIPIGTNNTPEKVEQYRLSRITGISVGFSVDNGSGGYEGRSSWGIDGQFEEGTTFSTKAELEQTRTSYFNLYKDAVRTTIEKEPGYANKQWRFVCLFTEDHRFEGDEATAGTHHFEQWTLFFVQDGKVPQSVSTVPIKEANQLYIYMGDNAQYIYNRSDIIGKPGVRSSSSVSTYDEVQSIRQFLAPWYIPDRDVLYGKGTIDFGNGPIEYQPTGWITIYHYQEDGSYSFAKYRKENGERVRMNQPVLNLRPKLADQNFLLADIRSEEKVMADLIVKQEIDQPWQRVETFMTEYGTNTVLRAFTVSDKRFYGAAHLEAPGLPTQVD